MSLLSPVLDPHDPDMATQGSTLSDTVIGLKSQPSSESEDEQQGSYELDDEDKEEDETPVPEELEEDKFFDAAPAVSPSPEPSSPTITFSVDNKSPTAQFTRQPSDSGGSPSAHPKPGTVPVLRPISPIPGPLPGVNFQPIKIVSASSTPSPSLMATPSSTSAVSPVQASSPRLSVQPVNPARPSSPAVSSGYYPPYPTDISPGTTAMPQPYYPPGSYISTAPSTAPGQQTRPVTYSEVTGSGFLGGGTPPYGPSSPIPPNYGQQPGAYSPNVIYPPVSNYNFPASSTAPIQMPTPNTVPSVPRNTPVSGFHRPPTEDHGLDLEELRIALQNDLDPPEVGNRAHKNSSGRSTPSQGSRTGFSSQSSSGTSSPYTDRKTSWPASATRPHHPPYPMNRSVSSPERHYGGSGDRDNPLFRRPELGNPSIKDVCTNCCWTSLLCTQIHVTMALFIQR